MISFLHRVQNLLAERGEVLNDLYCGVGVHRTTFYKRPKSKAIIAAVAYYLDMDADELVAGTDVEEVWNKELNGY